MRLSDSEARRRAERADHGTLGTIGADGTPDLVPTCFAIDGDDLGVPIDEIKPKSSTDLQRRRNLDRDPRATLLVERWDPADWSRLWWVRLRLERTLATPSTVEHLAALLRRRYRQYAAAPFAEILTFRITAAAGWEGRRGSA